MPDELKEITHQDVQIVDAATKNSLWEFVGKLKERREFLEDKTIKLENEDSVGVNLRVTTILSGVFSISGFMYSAPLILTQVPTQFLMHILIGSLTGLFVTGWNAYYWISRHVEHKVRLKDFRAQLKKLESGIRDIEGVLS